MSGKATFHTKIARAINHIVNSKQYSSQDSAGYAPLKTRNITSQRMPLPHRIVYATESTTTSEPEENEGRQTVDSICLSLFVRYLILFFSS